MAITRGYDHTMNPRYWPSRWQKYIDEIAVITHEAGEEYWVTLKTWRDEEPRMFKSLDDLDRYVAVLERMDF
jgi:hypothetical protein